MNMKLIVAGVFAVVFGCLVHAQAPAFRDPNIPRTADGKPNLSAPASKITGKPDLSGLWQSQRTPMSEFAKVLPPQMLVVQPDFYDVTKHFINVFWDMNPAEWPRRPEAAALSEQYQKSGKDFQAAYCLPGSVPAALMVINFKMIQ